MRTPPQCVKKISKTEYVDLRTGEVKLFGNSKKNQAKKIQKTYRIMNLNWKANTKMMTLTTQENITDLKVFKPMARKIIRKLGLQRMFAGSYEQQERGAWHAHIAIFFPENKRRDFMKDINSWRKIIGGLGTLNWTKPEDLDENGKPIKNLRNYIVKYITKAVQKSTERKFFHARGLIKDNIIYTGFDHPAFSKTPMEVRFTCKDKMEKYLHYKDTMTTIYKDTPEEREICTKNIYRKFYGYLQNFEINSS